MPRPAATVLAMVVLLGSCGSSKTDTVTSSTTAPLPSPTPTPVHLPSIPNGVYTAYVTRRDLRIFARRYLPPSGESPLQEVGSRSVRLFNGHWHGRPQDLDGGIYYLADGHLVFEWTAAAPGYQMFVEWKLKGKCLYLTVLSNNTGDPDALRGDRYAWQVKPLCRKR